MSIRFQLAYFRLGGILPYGWANFLGEFNGRIMGHEFTLVGGFRVVSYRQVLRRSVQPLPHLRWSEREYWWQGRPDGSWEYMGENDKGDLYRSNPRSKTWGGFTCYGPEPSDGLWLADPGLPVRSAVQDRCGNRGSR